MFRDNGSYFNRKEITLSELGAVYVDELTFKQETTKTTKMFETKVQT